MNPPGLPASGLPLSGGGGEPTRPASSTAAKPPAPVMSRRKTTEDSASAAPPPTVIGAYDASLHAAAAAAVTQPPTLPPIRVRPYLPANHRPDEEEGTNLLSLAGKHPRAKERCSKDRRHLLN